jgi:thiamine biosynthesis protein ThiI
MEEVLLLKCGELVLKGLNRGKFEERLMKIIRNRLRPVGEYNVHSSQSTIYVEPQNGASVDEALEVCKKIFGIVAIARAVVCEKDIEDIVAKGIPYLKSALDNVRTFKVETRRADKRFALTSPQISQRLGGDLHDAYPHLKAQMDDPQITVKVEVRERNAFVSAGVIPGAGGLPTGINGRGMLLLSGGIDSPVAGWMMAKRGLELGAVHFFSYPYTSEEAKQKVLDLAEIVARWSGKLTVSVVPFTKIQTEIRDKCPEDYFTIIMRRMMMRIAERVAEKQNCQGLITGESLGQVASQTIQAITVTNAVCEMPVLRPVIGMDKEEIVTISRHIGAFETSILPYEDCCTVFTPKHPQTKPRREEVEEMEKVLDIEALIEEAVAGIQRITKG